MIDQNIVVIKNVIHHYLPNSKIMLFGSRVKHQHKSDSDYDLLVSVPAELSLEQKKTIPPSIRKELAQYDIDIDIILKSEADIERKKHSAGNIIYYALKNAIEI